MPLSSMEVDKLFKLFCGLAVVFIALGIMAVLISIALSIHP